MVDFNGKCAVITGAGSGIGRALARALSEQGCTLFISDINEETLGETQRSLTAPDRSVSTVVDVADREVVMRWAMASTT